MTDLFDRLHQGIKEVSRKNIFFILGSPKSGTTWLQHILNGHQQICCHGESHIANIFSPELFKLLRNHNTVITQKNKMLGQEENGYPVFGDQEALYLAKSAFCLMFIAQQRGQAYEFIGEKTPDNIQNLELLSQHFFPASKYIHILRDGRDATVSGWHHIHRDTPEWAKKTYPEFSDYVPIYAEQWKKDITAARAFGIEHPARYFEIRYEDLKEASLETVEEILQFLGADHSQDSVTVSLNAGAFEKLSKGRSPGQENKQSHFRKGVSGEWVNCFDKTCKELFCNIAGDLLDSLQYKWQ